MSKPELNHSSDRKPEGFDQLVNDILITHKEPGNNSIQEVVLRRCVKYLNDNSSGRHWFCDPYMYPVAVHTMILFSFLDNDVLQWLKPNMAGSLDQCEKCIWYFNRGKSTLRDNFATNRNIPIRQVNQFLNIILEWEIARLVEVMMPFKTEIELDKEPKVTPRISNAIIQCLMGPNILRNHEDTRNCFYKILKYLRDTDNFPSPAYLLPGTIYLMFEGLDDSKKWADEWIDALKEQSTKYSSDKLDNIIVDEFSIHLYQIQDSKYFSNDTCIRFWQNFLKIYDLFENDAFLNKINKPSDIEAMSKYTNIRLYSLIRVFFNNIMSFLDEPLPILLKVLGTFLSTLKTEFWSHCSPYSFVNILDTVLGNPHFSFYLFSLNNGDQDSITDVRLQEALAWMKNLSDSLSGSQKQTACVRLGMFLLMLSPNSVKRPINLEMAEKRTIDLYQKGYFLLSQCFAINDNEIKLGDKGFSVELLKRRDARAAIENQSKVLVDMAFDASTEKSSLQVSAVELILRVTSYDILALAQNSILLLDDKIPTSFDMFPILWQCLSRKQIHTNVNLGIGLFKSLTFICNVIKINSKKNEDPANKSFNEARNQHNSNVSLILEYWETILGKLGLADPSTLKEIFGREEAILIGFWSSLFSPYVNQAALDVVYQVFDVGVGGRFETIQALIDFNLDYTLIAINLNIKSLTRMAAFEPCPKIIRILMDVIKALSDPLNGYLITSFNAENNKLNLENLWNVCWLFLVMVYRKTLVWASQYHLEELIEFTRDTLDLSDLLLDSFRIIHSTILDETSDRSHSLFRAFMNTFTYAIVWLRLGDSSLLNSCVNLVFKGLDLAKELRYSIDKEFISTFAKYGAKAKKFNNKLTDQQRLQILSKAREFDDDLVDFIVNETEQQKTKSRQVPQETRTTSETDSTPEPASYKYQTHVKQPKQQTLGRFGVVTSAPPVAPAPPQKGFKSVGLEAIRQELKSSRSSLTKPLSSLSPTLGVAPAAPRPAGFNNKRATPVGRSLQSLRRKRVDSESSEEEGDEDVDLSDLFVDKKKSRPKVVEVDINGKPVTKANRNRKVDQERKEEENMRMRLNVNLKPLYSTILRWNYNSTSNYPTDEREIYKQTKDVYADAKEYTKTIEPLLMLECWQGIQSAKQTGQEMPFELLIGSRTSCDGFFDVYASVKKSELNDRKIGDSDLLVLGDSSDQQFSNLKKVATYLKSPQTTTCLAKVREIKSANADYCDITLRVYPQGSMMGILTPKKLMTAMRVMQMVTIEREYSSLKGLPYYDLCDSILQSRPNKPMDINDSDADRMLSLYDVNRSQAKAIMGSYNSEGFSLIQGPPGTGKTKTILGIVGYSIPHQQKEGTIAIPRGPSDTNSLTNGKVDSNGPKILICAPSNAAVDELVLRLRKGVKTSKGEFITPRVVRLGRSDAINAAVRDLTLEELVDKQLQAQSVNTTSDPKIRMEHTKCISERDRLREELRKPNLKEEEIKELEIQLRDTNKLRNELAKKLDEQRERISIAYRTKEIERRQLQAKILNNSQIICSTLSGSAHDFLANMSMKFDQVIIDEACQCVELSAIIPLRYGCKKCIMVGDPNQLPPTVLSQAAASFNYEQSLFVRMQKMYPESVYLLDVQYRMHPEISKFPSSEFYFSRLHDGDGMAAKNSRPWHQDYPLSPYMFFDIVGKHQQNELSRSLFNYAEAQVALELVDKLIEILPLTEFSGRIGIISPYKEQIRTLKDVFKRKYGHSILSEIDFNTVDGFQGQEKEIIIMSCVRASDSGNVGFLSDIRRMNVALTRACTSLWILGNKKSLLRNNVWKRLLDDAAERDAISEAYPGFLKKAFKLIPAAPNPKRIENKREHENDEQYASKRSKAQSSKIDSPKLSNENNENSYLKESSIQNRDQTSNSSDKNYNPLESNGTKMYDKDTNISKDNRQSNFSKQHIPSSSGTIPKPKFTKKTSSIFINKKRPNPRR
ncbi:uncharacterized protein AC631_04849 [Debaryomyces fabryi]|uniref:UvrD-like helicase ATP-binding domain-containing protein n=1 Tax=Debaryomyces fabryi TaxID=58627 RepID=A0A0V1PT21_9ASCO|nr:uncharacterized protein AC631_04849 [Debaryomyces fabryi]KRZ99389.1 hypothetical protein AC631_04849 [Debaryomyces fabryi]CUM48614.1 unnamed protein product [Debaryomyces fabryi]